LEVLFIEEKIMSYSYRKMQSPLGELTLVRNSRGLAAILWEKDPIDRVRFAEAPVKAAHDPLLDRAADELSEYFAGRRTSFTVPLAPEGSEFQQRVWRLLREIPFGRTASYGELARRLGSPKLARAVGAANGRNPISVMVPCHRVIGSNGDLVGFAGGLPAKRFLLTLECERKA
jgi:methylated-DNA-[protein]-cysteine S-methyltransferase